MTIAKVFCSMTNKPLYTLPTMLLYAGMEDCRVVLDARGKRVYTCAYRNGKAVEEERVEYITDLENTVCDEKIIGDGQLFGKETYYPNMANNFLLLKNEWQKAENVHLVVPEYLKSSDAYNINK
jgi:inactive homolog of metal-dependent proteases, putative molecular chaperone